jgi:hypothetical protein
MKNRSTAKTLQMLCLAALIAIATIGMAPVRTDPALMTSSSDLKVRIVSIPKTVKACQRFKATFSVKNLGPDPAKNLYMLVMLPDPFEVVALRGAPKSLRVGQTVTFSATIKVVAFVPGESRSAWVGLNAISDPYPDISIDPNGDNNSAVKNLRIVSNPVEICP